MAEVTSSVVEIKSDHFRSESSDSFVCVSEDLPPSERSRASPNGNGGGGGDWEYLKMEVVEGVSGESSEGGDVTVTPVKRDGEGEGGKDGEGGRDGGKDGEGGREGGRERVENEESSDWENWDD